MRYRRKCLAAILCLGLAYAAPISDVGWNQGAHYALVRSMWRGSPSVDRDRWLSSDVAYVGGHYYAAKAPGLGLASLPAYAVLHLSGASRVIDRHASSRRRAASLTIWALGLLSVVTAATVLLLLVGLVGDRVAPGFGLASAVTLGVGTLVLPFATVYFAHVLSALFGFAAFVVLWRERETGARLMWVAVAGLLVGLAVTTEYTLALVGAPLLVYALVRPQARLRRGLAYGVGALVGIVPLLVFNWWAYRSPFHVSYTNAVSVPGSSGHDVLGANTTGFFGVGLPSPRVALELLFASRGLLTLSPVLAMSVVGALLMFRRGYRPESLVIGTVAVLFIVANSGYFLPFGGATPGPRFLIPALPFLAVPLAASYRAFPVTTLALGVASTVIFVTATSTLPLLPTADISAWTSRARADLFRETAASLTVASPRWLALFAFLVPLAAAIVLTVRAAPRVPVRRRDLWLALGFLIVWALAASLVPRLGAVPGSGAIVLVLSAAGVAMAVTLSIAHGVAGPSSRRRVSTGPREAE
jgi:hypothetical protein